MKFLIKQIIIVTLVCLFFVALSNLTELGIVGWILAASTGHGLYKIFTHVHNGYNPNAIKKKCESCNPAATGLSGHLESLMYDDASGVPRDE